MIDATTSPHFNVRVELRDGDVHEQHKAIG
jgi:hypothetical protein